MTPLLPLALAAPIFEPFKGLRVGLIHNPYSANAGDRLIERAAEQLLTRFGIAWRVVEPDGRRCSDVLLLFGGGNVGHPYCPLERDRRAAALASGLPCVLLPQTAYGTEVHAKPWHAAFARDKVSQALIHGSRLAPDLALFYRPRRALPEATEPLCVSFTTSYEGLWAGKGPDLRHAFSDPEDYLAHVASHREVTTDCLHVAIAGLIARRKVTLLPTKLHKQRSAWEAWLAALGCRWADTPDLAAHRPGQST